MPRDRTSVQSNVCMLNHPIACRTSSVFHACQFPLRLRSMPCVLCKNFRHTLADIGKAHLICALSQPECSSTA